VGEIGLGLEARIDRNPNPGRILLGIRARDPDAAAFVFKDKVPVGL
jgi:hypothetical protein